MVLSDGGLELENTLADGFAEFSAHLSSSEGISAQVPIPKCQCVQKSWFFISHE